MEESEEQLENFIKDFIRLHGRNPSEYILDFFKQQKQINKPLNNYYGKGLKQENNRSIINDK